MRHLAIVTTSGGPLGGLETFTRGLVNWLLDDGWRITVALSGHDFLSPECKSERLVIDPVAWVDAADLSGDRRFTRAAVANRFAWFRRTRPDVALFVQSSNTPLRASVLAARLAGVNVVSTQRTMPARLPEILSKRHGFGLIPGLGLHRKQLIMSSRFTARLASRVVYNNHAVRTLYESEYGYPAAKGVVIPNATTLSWQSSDIGSIRGADCPSSPLVVGYVGRLGREKRIDILLQALGELAMDVPMRAEIYGEGPERAALEELCRDLKLCNRVKFPGAITGARSVYDRFDLLALCSPRESSSNMVLEGMAAGKPAVVTHVGGLPELMDHGRAGICVEPLNVRELAAALRRLALDPRERMRLGRAARERAQVYHDPHRIAACWVGLLASLARPAKREREQTPDVLSGAQAVEMCP